ncbi:hypothetical protein HAX54_004578 [Datura stramonium]|uniref:Rho-GAP domain-containing protein n=1 Tax=Datura stramonium TaxID=4076 RepID=A0ABS8T764_DATST|nr:hypothetical protein [Datura stramonium]
MTEVLHSSPSPSSPSISTPTHNGTLFVEEVGVSEFNGFWVSQLNLSLKFPEGPPVQVPLYLSVNGIHAVVIRLLGTKELNTHFDMLYAQEGSQARAMCCVLSNIVPAIILLNEQLKPRGIVPDTLTHCLAGLIKAWFRELPSGVLDTFLLERNTPDQDEFSQYRNGVCSNMTQMADPLTALMYAVQVMNFLRTLIEKTLKEREDSLVEPNSVSNLDNITDDEYLSYATSSEESDDSVSCETPIHVNTKPKDVLKIDLEPTAVQSLGNDSKSKGISNLSRINSMTERTEAWR